MKYAIYKWITICNCTFFFLQQSNFLYFYLLLFLGTRECKDLDIDVQCDHRIRATRETSEEDGGTYVVSAAVPVEP